MSVDRWEYVGVTRNCEERFAHVPGIFDVEARYRSTNAMMATPKVTITAGWGDPDFLDDMMPLRIIIDAGDTGLDGQVAALSIEATFLRSIPYERLLGQAAVELNSQHGTLPAGEELPDFDQLRGEWPKGDTREVARWTAYVYTKAVGEGRAPTKSVADTFKVSRSTAQRMIALARELGMLASSVVGSPGSR